MASVNSWFHFLKIQISSFQLKLFNIELRWANRIVKHKKNAEYILHSICFTCRTDPIEIVNENIENVTFKIYTVLIVHRIVLFWEPDRCFQDGGQENRREVGTYFITISSVY